MALLAGPSQDQPGGRDPRVGAEPGAGPAAVGYRLVRLASVMVSALAAAAIGVHSIWPALKVDLVIVALLVFGSLPVLRGIIQSISLRGGASIEMRDYERARAVLREERHTAEAVRAIATAAGMAPASERIRQINALAERYEEPPADGLRRRAHPRDGEHRPAHPEPAARRRA
jgi:hypothetical protein